MGDVRHARTCAARLPDRAAARASRRSSVGDLFVELRSHPAPGDLRDALARSLRDPSLTLAYWLPEFESWADLNGVASNCRTPAPEERRPWSTAMVSHMAALLHDPALEDEPELLAAVGAAAGIALENGRLQAEQQAHLEELKGSRARRDRSGSEGAAAAGAQPSRRRSAAARRAFARLESARKAAGEHPDAGSSSTQRSRDHRLAGGAAGRGTRSASGRAQRSRAGHRAGAGSRSRVCARTADASRSAERLPEQIEVAAYYVVIREPREHRQARAGDRRERRGGHATDEAWSSSRSSTTGSVAPTASVARGCAGSPIGSRRSAAVFASGAPQGGGTRVRAEIPCA